MPPEAASVELAGDGGRVTLNGDLDFDTVSGVYGDFRVADHASEIVVDLAGVGRADSAGLALLVHWVAEAKRAGRALRLENVPEQLGSIARVCGVAGLLGLS